MFDQAAIIQLQEGASIAQAHEAAQTTDVNQPLALPSNFKLHDIESFLTERRRARGTMETADLASFVSYVDGARQTGAKVFIDQTAMSAQAVLNLGTITNPGHADNRAIFEQPKTAAYRALLEIADGNGRTQRDIAEFIEDWADHIDLFDDQDHITMGEGLAAIRAITIETARKVEQTEGQLSASKSAFEQVQASAKTRIPTHIHFQTKPYELLDERLFGCRLGILTGGDKIGLNLRIRQAEKHAEEMATELAGKVREGFRSVIPANQTVETDIDILLGTYTRKD